jgi:TonB family protein
MKDYKKAYGVYLRTGLVVSLVVFSIGFLLIPYQEPEPFKLKREVVTMIEHISAEIDKYEEPPPLERPKVAIEADNEIAEQQAVETIAQTDFNEHIIKTIPTGPEIEIVEYYKVEIKPTPVSMPKPVYPSLPLQAGIEGTTVVKMLVDIDGSVIDVKILKSSGNQMLDQEAVKAASQSIFTPAKQRDKFVRVWVSRPIKFQIKNNT